MKEYAKLIVYTLVFWILFLLHQWQLPDGIQAVKKLEEAVNKEQDAIDKLVYTLGAYECELYRIHTDKQYVEELIRLICVYAKPGEHIHFYKPTDYKKMQG